MICLKAQLTLLVINDVIVNPLALFILLSTLQRLTSISTINSWLFFTNNIVAKKELANGKLTEGQFTFVLTAEGSRAWGSTGNYTLDRVQPMPADAQTASDGKLYREKTNGEGGFVTCWDYFLNSVSCAFRQIIDSSGLGLRAGN